MHTFIVSEMFVTMVVFRSYVNFSNVLFSRYTTYKQIISLTISAESTASQKDKYVLLIVNSADQ